jgi:hypothetical protein
MILVALVLATVLGGTAAAVLMMPFGWLAALVAAPLGGSLCALLAAGYLVRWKLVAPPPLTAEPTSERPLETAELI